MSSLCMGLHGKNTCDGGCIGVAKCVMDTPFIVLAPVFIPTSWALHSDILPYRIVYFVNSEWHPAKLSSTHGLIGTFDDSPTSVKSFL